MLGLDRMRVHRGRYEEMELGRHVDLVTCRAVKLKATTREKLLSSLGVRGRFLWFGAEKRLEAVCRDLRLGDELKLEGPHRLLEEGPTGWLVAIEKR